MTSDGREGLSEVETSGTGVRAGASLPRMLLFGVGGRVYGCEIEVVREIVPFRRCTRLPGAPPFVCGLTNLRGTLVTVLDMGLRLGGAAVNRTDGSVVLVEYGQKVVGLGVDEVRDVQSVTGGGDGAPSDGGGVVRGVGRAGETVVVLLDVPALVRQVLL